MSVAESLDPKLQYLLGLAAEGWHIGPVKGKNPGGYLGAEWQLKFTTDAEQIREWHAKHSGANWGVELHKSELATIDLDSTDPKWLPALKLQYGVKFDEGRASISGGGGWHVFYRAGTQPIPAGKYPWGEVFDGSTPRMIVLPGSTHPDTGERYRVHVWGDVPDGGAGGMAPSIFGPSSIDDRETIPDGEQEDAVRGWALQLARYVPRLSEAAATEALWVQIQERCPNTKRQPWAKSDAAAKIRRAFKLEIAAPIELEPAKRRLEVVTLADVCRLPDPPETDRIIGDLVVRGQRTLVAGGTGEGKTSVVQQMIAAATVGPISWDDCLGQSVHPVERVLVIDAEQGVRTIKRRAAEFGITERENIDYVRVPGGLRLDSDRGDVEAVAEVLAARKYDIVVLDPFYKLHSGDSNSDREIKQLLATLDGWREQYGFALVMPTHTRKLAPGVTTPTIADVFGTSALTWGAEIVLMIQRRRPGYSHLHVVKDRDGDMSGKRLGLFFDRDRGGFTLDPEADKAGADRADELRDAVYRYVGENPGCSQRDVRFAKDIGGSERSRVAMLDELVGLDEVFTSAGKTGALEHRLVRGIA